MYKTTDLFVRFGGDRLLLVPPCEEVTGWAPSDHEPLKNLTGMGSRKLWTKRRMPPRSGSNMSADFSVLS